MEFAGRNEYSRTFFLEKTSVLSLIFKPFTFTLLVQQFGFRVLCQNRDEEVRERASEETVWGCMKGMRLPDAR